MSLDRTLNSKSVQSPQSSSSMNVKQINLNQGKKSSGEPQVCKYLHLTES